jgi:hypothetical protein
METNALAVAIVEAFSKMQAVNAVSQPLSNATVVLIAVMTALPPTLAAIAAMITGWRTRDKVHVIEEGVSKSVQQNVDLDEKLKTLSENVNGKMGRLLETTEKAAHAKGALDQKVIDEVAAAKAVLEQKVITDAVAKEVEKQTKP